MTTINICFFIYNLLLQIVFVSLFVQKAGNALWETSSDFCVLVGSLLVW